MLKYKNKTARNVSEEKRWRQSIEGIDKGLKYFEMKERSELNKSFPPTI